MNKNNPSLIRPNNLNRQMFVPMYYAPMFLPTYLNRPISNQNLLLKLKNNPGVFYVFVALILFLIIMMFMIIYNASLSLTKPINSLQQMTSDTFIILFFALLIVGSCILILPILSELKGLFEQIGSVTYTILYTIFAILVYTMVSKDVLKEYSFIINPLMLGLGTFSFYKGITDNYLEKFNINYERIKSLVLLFCLVSLIITFYNINSSAAVSQYFQYLLTFTIILSVFAFLYVIILMTLPGQQNIRQYNRLASNLPSFNLYGIVPFILFLIGMAIFLTIRKNDLFDNKQKMSSVMIILLVICILWSILLAIYSFPITNNFTDSNNVKLYKSSLFVLFSIIISVLFIYWISYNIENIAGKSDIVRFILISLIVILMLGVLYKSVYNNNYSPNNYTKNNSQFMSFSFMPIINSLLYIPFLASSLFNWIGNYAVGQYNGADAGSFMMLGLAIALIVAYFKSPALFNLISTQGGKQLVNKPVYTNTEYSLGNYQELNESEHFDYQYAISCWIFIDSLGPNTNASYNKFTSLLNFGDKPNIQYNGRTHTLMITMQQKNLKDVTKNKLIDFDDNGNRIIYIDNNFLLQKWNNIIINYNGGTLDIFLNGKLVKSSIEVVPYYTFDNLTIGENGGIKGGICNVVYFRRALTSQNIYFLYNTVKDKHTPTLNDSNETIMIKNINQTINSAEKVTNS
jgi:hypothetical protein